MITCLELQRINRVHDNKAVPESSTFLGSVMTRPNERLFMGTAHKQRPPASNPPHPLVKP